jgi:hypothetical protein
LTESEFRSFLLVAAILAAIIGLVNLLRPNRRWLGAGCLIAAGSALTYWFGAPIWVVAIVGGLALFSLSKDVGARTRRSA